MTQRLPLGLLNDRAPLDFGLAPFFQTSLKMLGAAHRALPSIRSSATVSGPLGDKAARIMVASIPACRANDSKMALSFSMVSIAVQHLRVLMTPSPRSPYLNRPKPMVSLKPPCSISVTSCRRRLGRCSRLMVRASMKRANADAPAQRVGSHLQGACVGGALPLL